MSGDRAGRAVRVNPALAVFGLLCVVVSVLVLAGERDWGWLADSYIAPAILLGLGGVVLAATLWPAGRTATTMGTATTTGTATTRGTTTTTGTAGGPTAAGDADLRGSVGRPPDPGPGPSTPPATADEPAPPPASSGET